MGHVNEILIKQLKKEAKQRMALELEARLAAVDEEIALQADVGRNVHCDSTIEKHVGDAAAYARQEIMRELEVEADEWMKEEIRKRTGEAY